MNLKKKDIEMRYTLELSEEQAEIITMRQHGIYPEQTTEMRRAQDIWQVIRHRLWKDRHGDKDDWCVDTRKPLKMSDEPLPKMKGINDEI